MKARRDPHFYNPLWTFEEKIGRLRQLAPEKVEAIEVFADMALRDAWPSKPDPLGVYGPTAEQERCAMRTDIDADAMRKVLAYVTLIQAAASTGVDEIAMEQEAILDAIASVAEEANHVLTERLAGEGGAR